MIKTHLPKADGDGVYTKYLTSPDHHQQYARLRNRQATQESAGAAADRLSSQPASTRRPKDLPRLLDWRGRFRSGRTSHRGRGPTSFGLAVRRQTRPSLVQRTGRLQFPASRVYPFSLKTAVGLPFEK